LVDLFLKLLKYIFYLFPSVLSYDPLGLAKKVLELLTPGLKAPQIAFTAGVGDVLLGFLYLVDPQQVEKYL